MYVRPISKGVRKGCRLSPVLLNLYLDHVITEWEDSNCLQTNVLAKLRFVNDEVIITASVNCLQKRLHQLSKVALTYNLTISAVIRKLLTLKRRN
jgi:hypothetical protein